MKRIYKYGVHLGGTVLLPTGAEILSVGVQHNQLVCWASAEPSDRIETRHLLIGGMGFEPPVNPGRFLGTHLLDGGSTVLHVWERA